MGTTSHKYAMMGGSFDKRPLVSGLEEIVREAEEEEKDRIAMQGNDAMRQAEIVAQQANIAEGVSADIANVHQVAQRKSIE